MPSVFGIDIVRVVIRTYVWILLIRTEWVVQDEELTLHIGHETGGSEDV